MTGLLLATLLTLDPGIQLTDHPEARHLALSEARFTPLLVSDEETAGPRPTFEQMSAEQLRTELRRLDDARPGLGGPIALLSVGVALIIPGIGITAIGLIALFASTQASTAVLAFTTASAILLGVGVIMVTVGIILAVVGGISLGARIKARSESGREADEVRRRLESLDHLAPQPVPPSPQANLVVPGAMQTVLTF